MIHDGNKSLNEICKYLRAKGYKNFIVVGRKLGRKTVNLPDDKWFLRLENGIIIDLGHTKPEAIETAKKMPKLR